MANTLYDLGRNAFLSAGINWGSDTIKIALISTSLYTFSQSHQFWSSASAGLIGTAQTLASKATPGNNGTVDAADVTFTAVTAGSTVSAFIIYKDTGVAGTSPLIAYFDTGTNMPIVTNGGDIIIQFNASGIFKL